MARKENRDRTNTLRLGAELATLRSELSGGVAELRRGADVRVRLERSIQQNPMPWIVGGLVVAAGVTLLVRSAVAKRGGGLKPIPPERPFEAGFATTYGTGGSNAQRPSEQGKSGAKWLRWSLSKLVLPMAPTILRALWKRRSQPDRWVRLAPMLVKSMFRS